MAKIERLSKFSEFKQINSIVEDSHGAYTHDEAFELDVEFCYFLSFMKYEEAMYENRYQVEHKNYIE